MDTFATNRQPSHRKYCLSIKKEVDMSGKTSQNHLVRVFSGNLWQAEIVQGLLQSNHIRCMIENDTLSAITSPYATLGGEVWVLVNERDEEAAISLIKNNRLECNPFN